jgi:hypothetical protein
MSEPLFANRFIVYTGDVSSLSNARLGLPKLGAPLRAPTILHILSKDPGEKPVKKAKIR